MVGFTATELREDAVNVEDVADSPDVGIDDVDPVCAFEMAFWDMLAGCVCLLAYLPWKKANWFGRDGLNCSTGLICLFEDRREMDDDDDA